MPRVLRPARLAGAFSSAVASKPGRILPVLVVFLVTFVIPVHAVAAAPALPTYLALGDSLSVGIGATVPSQFGFVGRLQQFIRVQHRGPERVANLAVGGETSTSFIASGQLARAQAYIADPSTDVQLITLTIGGND